MHAGSARADGVATTQRVLHDYSALIQQLGDPDPDVRENASRRLLAAGADAVGPLQEAAKNSPDPEIVSNASGLLSKIATPDVPTLANDQAVVNGQPMIVIVNGRIIQVNQQGAVQINAQAGNIQIVPPGDNLTQLSNDLDREMRQANLTDEQCKAVHAELERVEDAKGAMDLQSGNGLPMTDVDRQKQVDAYLAECDALRKELADLKLADPGGALPPPAAARLGVQIQPVLTANGSAIAISSVSLHSRAERLGLEPGDVVVSANGKPVPTVNDLRAIVMASKRLEITIHRNGQEIKLQEGPATTEPAR